MNELEVEYKTTVKRLTIRVKSDGMVKVTAPTFITKSTIDSFIQKNQSWIARRQNDIKNKILQAEKAKNEIWILGNKYLLKINNDVLKNKLIIGDNDITLDIKEQKSKDDVLKKELITLATKVFTNRLSLCHAIFSTFFNCKMPALKVRFMKTRWGSMSSKNIICLNARLIYASTEIIDYVIMHELCHIKHKNHGHYFYGLLSKVCPEWKQSHINMKSFFGGINCQVLKLV